MGAAAAGAVAAGGPTARGAEATAADDAAADDAVADDAVADDAAAAAAAAGSARCRRDFSSIAVAVDGSRATGAALLAASRCGCGRGASFERASFAFD